MQSKISEIFITSFLNECGQAKAYMGRHNTAQSTTVQRYAYIRSNVVLQRDFLDVSKQHVVARYALDSHEQKQLKLKRQTGWCGNRRD